MLYSYVIGSNPRGGKPDAERNAQGNAVPMWERACSRRRCISQYQCLLGRRLREQARSHRGPALD
ncbi:hypothetical protein PflCFBP13517_04495 [Pseudomonas fluorescens]|nr:hypothetical protein PflCFBP13517_04495 [Pseudomonas fluorescens]